MLTRNYDSMTVGYMTMLPSGTPTETDWLGGLPGVIKDHNGVVRAMTRYPTNSFSAFGNSSNLDNFVQMPSETSLPPVLLVGSSNAAESYNDYSLAFISGLSTVGYRSAAITYSEDGCIYTTVKTFINNTDKDITVNELGLSQHIATSSMAAGNCDILLYRKKLGTPVTLKANGGTATFSLVIDIPYANKP